MNPGDKCMKIRNKKMGTLCVSGDSNKSMTFQDFLGSNASISKYTCDYLSNVS